MIPRKQRKDARLKNLTDDQQAKLFGWINGEAGYSGAMLACKKEFGFATHYASLRDFYVWYSLRQQSLEDEETVDALIERIESTQGETLAPEKRFSVGQEMFELLAIRRQDPKAWTALQLVASKRQEHALNRQKFQRETCELFVKWSGDQKAREIADNPKLSNKDKIETLGQQMFGALWE